MNTTSFLAAQRTPEIINRKDELESIQRAIYQPEASLQIILILGEGGMGKSRLVEEVLWRGNNWRARQKDPRDASESDWEHTASAPAVVGDILDMGDVRLHSRSVFLRAIRDALVWQGNGIVFSRYDSAYEEFNRHRLMQGDYNYLQQLERRAEESFFEDYRQNAKEKRLVLVLDTVEKLYPVGGTRLLIDEGLLKPEDMSFYTYQWLLQQIETNGFPNTTLLFVGRKEEGREFFENINAAAKKNQGCKVSAEIELKAFSLEDTHTYFQVMANSWENSAKTESQFEILADTLKNIAADNERLEIIWIYTGGQPVRLALYTDLIVEDWSIPVPLQNTLEEARQIQQEPTQLGAARVEIESGFLRLLFGRSGLRANILQWLVRVPRGLNLEQIYYLLSGETPQMPPDSRASAYFIDKKHIDIDIDIDIDNELKILQHLTLVKIRPDGRLGLQDEIYRIYTRAIARDAAQREAETQARKQLYRKLHEWAENQLREHRKVLREYQREDEARLPLSRPALALTVRFPLLSRPEQQRRDEVREEIQRWEFESLHYALLLDLSRNFNHILFEIADRERIANDEDSFSILQAERWQLLQDPAFGLEEFGDLREWASLLKRGESALQALRRVALQDDVVSWTKLFALRKQYQRAIDFADAIERAIQTWVAEERKKRDAQFRADSWMHTLARHERALWSSYAQILKGENMLAWLQKMVIARDELKKLAESSEEQNVFPERGAIGEMGFKGHLAESKVRQLIVLYNNSIGYGYTNLGLTSQARKYYSEALRMMREVEFDHLEATVRNNLSRVLAERGHTRGRRVCMDALEIRQKLGSEVPIALSYNTLALIDNKNGRHDLAWVEAAIAWAYVNRVNEPRVQGLVLLQLGEALRRLAKQTHESYHLRGDSPDIVLQAADQAINRAIDLFTSSSAAEELMRQVEAWIEKGCLERDWIPFEQNEGAKERHCRDALYYLEQALRAARHVQNQRLLLDAHNDIAWTHYRFGKLDQSEKMLQEAEALIPENCKIVKERDLPPAERDDIYIYQEYSKIYGLRSRIAFKKFEERVKELARSKSEKEPASPEGEKETNAGCDKHARREKTHQDKEAQQYLSQAAEFSVLGLAYSQLHSPRSSALSTIYDAIYDSIKGFNLVELEDFTKYVRQFIKQYKTNEIKPIDMSNLDEFLQQAFGLGK